MVAQDRFSSILYRTCLLGCFLGLVATVYFLAGLSGYIGNPLLNVATAAALLLVALFFLAVFFLQMWVKSRLGCALWVLILVVLLAEVVLGLVPPVARDELTHHLAIPKLYVNSGRILEVPFAPYSYYPMLLDMLYTPFVKWGWDSVPKLVHGLKLLVEKLAASAQGKVFFLGGLETGTLDELVDRFLDALRELV
ncbi:MAG: hypothetical protein IIA23_04340 [Chloroflexi bacterium]|nr:hypothetical protein [Chloroflexota bacterium]